MSQRAAVSIFSICPSAGPIHTSAPLREPQKSPFFEAQKQKFREKNVATKLEGH